MHVRWCCALTAVDANPQLELLVWPVADLEGAHGVQQCQGHAGDLSAVQLPVPHREPRYHHVSIAYRLHLEASNKARDESAALKAFFRLH